MRLPRYFIWIACALMYLYAFLLMSSCRTCEPIIETVEKQVTVKIHTRDTVITDRPDSASMRALLYCDSAYNVVLDELITMQGDRIETELKMERLRNGDLLLNMGCKEDSLRYEIQLRDSTITELQKQTVVVREKYIPNYYKNTSIGFWVLLGIIIVYIVVRILIRVYLKK